MAKHSNEEEHNSSSPSSQGEQSNLEDTQPRRIAGSPISPEQQATISRSPADEETPVDSLPLDSGAPDTDDISESFDFFTPDPGVTQPTPVVGEWTIEEPPRGFEQTIPPPANFEFDAVPPADSEAAPVNMESLTPDAAPVKTPPVRKKKKARKAARATGRWVLIPLLGLVALVVIAGLSAAGGYASGIGLRKSAESTQMVQTVAQQFELGLQDLQNGNYDYARQRFEYVIRLNPGYPGATEKLAEVLSYLNATATSTPAPTPTLTPTPDSRANEELFSQGQQAFVDSNWSGAIDALLSLRGKDPGYRAIEIDGMLYLALRNRGREKIVSADLESGIYDLTLANKFAPLDSEAAGLLNWSQLYITGASFWEIDWQQVIQYFSEIAPQMPNLMDSSGMTASERYRLALFNYGNQLASGGDYCKALQYYEQSLQMGQAADVQTAYEQAQKGCDGGKGNETPNSGGGGGGKKKTPTAETPAEPPPPVVP